MVGSFSRIGLSLCTYVPPNQAGVFSDSGALNRAVQRPANAFDAFRRAAEEGLSGVWSGISGTLMDPTQVCTKPGRLRPSLLPLSRQLMRRHQRAVIRTVGVYLDSKQQRLCAGQLALRPSAGSSPTLLL